MELPKIREGVVGLFRRGCRKKVVFAGGKQSKVEECNTGAGLGFRSLSFFLFPINTLEK